MSTLVLQVAGQVVGTIVGGPIGGAIGQALGALAGSALDGAVLGALTPTRRVEGPRLATIAGLGSTEGAPIPRLYGRARLGGEVIWATRIREDVTWRKQRGSKGASARPATACGSTPSPDARAPGTHGRAPSPCCRGRGR